jgi:hypothetical protein
MALRLVSHQSPLSPSSSRPGPPPDDPGGSLFGPSLHRGTLATGVWGCAHSGADPDIFGNFILCEFADERQRTGQGQAVDLLAFNPDHLRRWPDHRRISVSGFRCNPYARDETSIPPGRRQGCATESSATGGAMRFPQRSVAPVRQRCFSIWTVPAVRRVAAGALPRVLTSVPVGGGRRDGGPPRRLRPMPRQPSPTR